MESQVWSSSCALFSRPIKTFPLLAARYADPKILFHLPPTAYFPRPNAARKGGL